MIALFAVAAVAGVVLGVVALSALQRPDRWPSVVGVVGLLAGAAAWAVGEATDVGTVADAGAALVLLLVVAYACIYGGTAAEWRTALGTIRRAWRSVVGR